jgi:DegV family protein with EDD domain
MARKVAVVTDSSACIPGELVAEYGIEVVPMSVILEGKTYREGIDISPAEFYARLREAKDLPTTAHSPPGAHLEAYRRASCRAADVLCITISKVFSGQFNSAWIARELAGAALPGVTVAVLDCGTAAAQGFVVLAAAQAAASGRGLAEVAETARGLAQRVRLLAMVADLNYLVKGGHAPKIAAMASSLFRIKPLFTLSDGEARLVANARTTAGAIKRMLSIMKRAAIGGKPRHVAVMHADALSDAFMLQERIAAQFDCAELWITEFTPVMGAHIGPGLIGVAFYSED